MVGHLSALFEKNKRSIQGFKVSEPSSPQPRGALNWSNASAKAACLTISSKLVRSQLDSTFKHKWRHNMVCKFRIRGSNSGNSLTTRTEGKTKPSFITMNVGTRWIDQVQNPISLVASLDTVPMICRARLLHEIVRDWKAIMLAWWRSKNVIPKLTNKTLKEY